MIFKTNYFPKEQQPIGLPNPEVMCFSWAETFIPI